MKVIVSLHSGHVEQIRPGVPLPRYIINIKWRKRTAIHAKIAEKEAHTAIPLSRGLYHT
uniref:Uncharacterized protein n=1 Tax=Thermosporothrix sp. COM3 TaxID=2490863 RepID=A0A455SM23_9CHLR|nr:hypothetical protein KTC_35270 [Thermosporothrix sp. COM3]